MNRLFCVVALALKSTPTSALSLNERSSNVFLAAQTGGEQYERQIYKRLWGGDDLESREFDELLARHAPSFSQRLAEKGFDGLEYRVVGTFDSGTHLLDATISANFPTAFKESPDAKTIWTHSASGSEDFTEQFRSTGKDLSDIAVIAIVRSPVSQLYSWHKSPYELKECMSWNESWYEPQQVDAPCRTYLRACTRRPYAYHGCNPNRGEHDHADSDPQCRIQEFDSLADVYNTYVQQYLNLTTEGNFAKVEIVEYEQLVRNPFSVVQRLAEVLELPVPKKIAAVEGSAKSETTGVGSNDRDEALRMIDERAWLNVVPEDVVESFCKGLSQPAVGKFGSSSENDNYLADCGQYI